MTVESSKPAAVMQFEPFSLFPQSIFKTVVARTQAHRAEIIGAIACASCVINSGAGYFPSIEPSAPLSLFSNGITPDAKYSRFVIRIVHSRLFAFPGFNHFCRIAKV